MIVLDTHIVIWEALDPKAISSKAKRAIQKHRQIDQLMVSQISLWEIAMLMKNEQLQIDSDYISFISLLQKAKKYCFVDITPEIAYLSVNLPDEINKDPADRIIAATAVYNKAKLVTADKNLRTADTVKTIW